jgi:dTDP-4-amino-4,6-dideoxygalactose transaminase
MNSEDDRRLREKLWSDVSGVAVQVRELTRQIYENGPIDRITLRQLEDRIMNDTFWVGVYPGMTDEMIDYMAKTITEAVNQ